jgi:hypothetical protein
MFYNVSILHHDVTRAPAKEFTCVHTLGVAMMRGTLVALHAAQIHLHGRKRMRGRKPLAAPAWEMMPLAIDTPPQHPQQDPGILMGAIPAVAPNVVAGANLVADLIAE